MATLMATQGGAPRRSGPDGASSFSERPVLEATAADGVTADVVINELNRRDVPVVRINPVDIGKDLAVSAGGSLRDGVGDTSRAARGGTLTGIRTRICTESSLYMGTVAAWRFLRS
ncbi:hypothetical protein [Streptomyces europaeiscabiei]|uniref:hypothetical protein n=1 Tax=Streptomyces europaeiscabiei TaxID=146819 RepID=UPI0029C0C81F|nr:hypothetical protein [Streptomyces europaeiscabiei]